MTLTLNLDLAAVRWPWPLLQCLWRCYAAEPRSNFIATWQIHIQDERGRHHQSNAFSKVSREHGAAGFLCVIVCICVRIGVYVSVCVCICLCTCVWVCIKIGIFHALFFIYSIYSSIAYPYHFYNLGISAIYRSPNLGPNHALHITEFNRFLGLLFREVGDTVQERIVAKINLVLNYFEKH